MLATTRTHSICVMALSSTCLDQDFGVDRLAARSTGTTAFAYHRRVFRERRQCLSSQPQPRRPDRGVDPRRSAAQHVLGRAAGRAARLGRARAGIAGAAGALCAGHPHPGRALPLGAGVAGAGQRHPGITRRPGNRQLRGQLNQRLEQQNHAAGSSVLYLLDRNGETIAASNWRDWSSFVGNNYAFRPYFRDAVLMAAGVTSRSA